MLKLYKSIWKKCCKSVCKIYLINSNNIEVLTVTGFKSGNYIFTSDLILHYHNYEIAEISFVADDGFTPTASTRLTQHDLSDALITSYDEEITGFAMISTTDMEFEQIPSLPLANNGSVEIGQSVAVMGFQYDNPNLTIKSGILSTFVFHNDIRYLQFDGSIIWGNSGSPLIDLETQEVLGIIGYKLDIKKKAYEQMIEISKSNIRMLEKAQGEIDIKGVDPIQVLIAWQKQIKQLSSEIFKSTGNSIGIAIDMQMVKQLVSSSGIEAFWEPKAM
ncbi:MAG: trypsin-like peptidase domain-containing protein, partial [Bacteroidales bacterium]|nr:trypsin-like peptidase domain-containing protein [Bacteroidales bacterium]